jgi:hypothetical protein
MEVWPRVRQSPRVGSLLLVIDVIASRCDLSKLRFIRGQLSCELSLRGTEHDRQRGALSSKADVLMPLARVSNVRP